MTSAVTPLAAERVLKPVRVAGYTILVLAILFPLVDLLSSLLPFHLENATWRFGAAGLISNYFMGASIELFLMVLMALFGRQRRALLVLAVVCVGVAVVLLGGAAMFALDAVQTRARVTPEQLHRFELASVVAFFKMVLFALANGLLARGAFRGAKEERSTTRVKGAPAPLVVSQTASSTR
jgi:hypothetical protein